MRGVLTFVIHSVCVYIYIYTVCINIYSIYIYRIYIYTIYIYIQYIYTMYICIYNIYIYIYNFSTISTTLSRRLTMHLSDTSSIAQHLKNIHAQQQNHEKFSPKTQQYQNIKITNKNNRFSKHYILGTCNTNFTELIFKPVLMYLNVFTYWHYL